MLERQTISLIPVDRTRLEELAPPDVPIPKPSIEHSIVKCDYCARDGWIGPAQLTHLTFWGGEKVCYYCLFEQMRGGGHDLKMISLDRTADLKPRRT